MLIGQQVEAPHEIVYGFKLKQPIDLISIACHYRAFETASAFASHMHELHKDISVRIAQSNTSYKLRADVRKILRTFYVSDRKILRTFYVGDFLMVQIRPERFSLGIAEKLHAHSASPFQIF